MMIDIVCRGSVEAPVRVPESLEVIDRNTRVSMSASKIHTKSPKSLFLLIYCEVGGYEVNALWPRRIHPRTFWGLKGVLVGCRGWDNCEMFGQTYTVIFCYISIRFWLGNIQNTLGTNLRPLWGPPRTLWGLLGVYPWFWGHYRINHIGLLVYNTQMTCDFHETCRVIHTKLLWGLIKMSVQRTDT